jgi:hypothetical protein
MLPTTLAERLLFVMVAIMAGFCEEVVFRAAYVMNHLPIH